MISKEEHSLAIRALEKIGQDIHYAATRQEQQAMLAMAEEQGQVALEAILGQASIPCFRYNLSSISCPTFGYITLNHENIHHIEDVPEFYRELGLDDELRLKGVLAEEYIWDEYHKYNSPRSEICLQVRIIRYLLRHSAAFIEQYAAQCDYWLASCLKRCVSGMPSCTNCSCNPILN